MFTIGVTIKDIAREAGVSIGTVDRVLHERPYVNKDVKARVQHVIQQLGYVPNRHASLLSKGVQKSIGFICIRNPEFFWNELARGAQAAADELHASGLTLHLRQISGSDMRSEYDHAISELLNLGVDMLIVVGMPGVAQLDAVRHCGVPLATVNIDLTDDSGRVFYLGPDDVRCGRIAADLVGRFMRRKGKVLSIIPTYRDGAPYISNQRLSGFEQSLRESFPEIEILDRAEYPDTEEGCVPDLSALIRRHNPDAVYVPSGTQFTLDEGEWDAAHRPVIVCHELSSQSAAMLRTDKIDAIISEMPYNQGYEAVRHAYSYLFDGAEPGTIIRAEVRVITRELLE